MSTQAAKGGKFPQGPAAKNSGLHDKSHKHLDISWSLGQAHIPGEKEYGC